MGVEEKQNLGLLFHPSTAHFPKRESAQQTNNKEEKKEERIREEKRGEEVCV